eukprot:7687303-Heterocapsa_arctica.AAC.1
MRLHRHRLTFLLPTPFRSAVLPPRRAASTPPPQSDPKPQRPSSPIADHDLGGDHTWAFQDRTPPTDEPSGAYCRQPTVPIADNR